MPRPGQTPQPQFSRSPQMPYGTVERANATRPQQARQPQARQASQPQGGQGSSPIEDFLFGATQRPTEPVTAGAPFGPGASPFDMSRVESPRDFMTRVVGQMVLAPDAEPELQGFLAKVQLGL